MAEYLRAGHANENQVQPLHLSYAGIGSIQNFPKLHVIPALRSAHVATQE